MMIKILLYIAIFILGELLINYTWFKYLKNYFNFQEAKESSEKIIFFELSTFKGIMERFLLSIGLIFNYAPIMIVFGTIKLGTRFKDNVDVKNDYFLIGNFSSLLLAMLYSYLYNLLGTYFSTL